MKERFVAGKTCTTCTRGQLSSFLTECVDCLKKDKPGNRFPNWEKRDEQITKQLD